MEEVGGSNPPGPTTTNTHHECGGCFVCCCRPRLQRGTHRRGCFCISRPRLSVGLVGAITLVHRSRLLVRQPPTPSLCSGTPPASGVRPLLAAARALNISSPERGRCSRSDGGADGAEGVAHVLNLEIGCPSATRRCRGQTTAERYSRKSSSADRV